MNLAEKGIHVNKIAVTVERTIQMRQYEPLKLSLSAEASVEEGTDVRAALDALTSDIATELSEQIAAVCPK